MLRVMQLNYCNVIPLDGQVDKSLDRLTDIVTDWLAETGKDDD